MGKKSLCSLCCPSHWQWLTKHNINPLNKSTRSLKLITDISNEPVAAGKRFRGYEWTGNKHMKRKVVERIRTTFETFI